LCVNVAPAETAVEPAQLDLSLAALFAGLRFSQGFLIQHLVEGVTEMRDALGADRVDAATRLLRDVLQTQGADADIRRRRVRPPG
jgi:hypothetical protein